MDRRRAVVSGSQRSRRGGAGFLSYPSVSPTPCPPWYSIRAHDSTLSVLNAILGRVRLPAVGVAGFKSVPLERRVIPTSIRMPTYFLPVDFYREKPKRPAIDIHRICSPNRQRVDMWRRTTGGLLELHRCAPRSGASPPAIWRCMHGRAPI